LDGVVHATPLNTTASQDAQPIKTALMRETGPGMLALSVWPAG